MEKAFRDFPVILQCDLAGENARGNVACKANHLRMCALDGRLLFLAHLLARFLQERIRFVLCGIHNAFCIERRIFDGLVRKPACLFAVAASSAFASARYASASARVAAASASACSTLSLRLCINLLTGL